MSRETFEQILDVLLDDGHRMQVLWSIFRGQYSKSGAAVIVCSRVVGPSYLAFRFILGIVPAPAVGGVALGEDRCPKQQML